MGQWHYTVDRGENIRNVLVFSPEGIVRTCPPQELTEFLNKVSCCIRTCCRLSAETCWWCMDGSGLMGPSSHPANEGLTSLE